MYHFMCMVKLICHCEDCFDSHFNHYSAVIANLSIKLHSFYHFHNVLLYFKNKYKKNAVTEVLACLFVIVVISTLYYLQPSCMPS